MFENAASAAPGKDRAGGQACELVGVEEQDLSLAFDMGDLVSFTNRIGRHQAANSEKSNRGLTLQRRFSMLSSSSASRTERGWVENGRVSLGRLQWLQADTKKKNQNYQSRRHT